MIKLKPKAKTSGFSSPFSVLSELAENHLMEKACKNKPCPLDVFTNIVSEFDIEFIGHIHPTLSSWLKSNPSWKPYLTTYRGNTIGLLSDGESAFFYTPFGLSLSELDDKRPQDKEVQPKLKIEDRSMSGHDDNMQLRRKIQRMLKDSDPLSAEEFAIYIDDSYIPFLEKGENIISFVQKHDGAKCYLVNIKENIIGVIAIMGVIDLFTPDGMPIHEVLSTVDL